MKTSLGIVTVLGLSLPAAAHAGISATLGVMAMSNSTKQGGQGTEGSTVLSQTNITWHGSWWGLGLFAQRDNQGKSEVDTAYGPRLELTWNPFYLEYGYAMKLNRSFTDRAIAEQEGAGSMLAIGTRFGLGAAKSTPGVGGLQGLFLQFTYTWRTQTVKTQDGEKLGEAIVQTDGYPLFGIGYGF
ncbi:MAG TPA: hypothetical protein VFO10_25975 [Oligoflexus sp.]|uniref:hypothetical protein n=1 Tax=Oligoflexus sp. TaxID=1971216 RepID=UPI002D80929E|nr:hypothetical protein [Oligoflexus sp.]HET9240739.1 hypothetical protein [Oligoflexus sp.]